MCEKLWMIAHLFRVGWLRALEMRPVDTFLSTSFKVRKKILWLFFLLKKYFLCFGVFQSSHQEMNFWFCLDKNVFTS